MYCSAAGGYRVKTGFFRPGADALCRNDGSLGPLGRRGRRGGWADRGPPLSGRAAWPYCGMRMKLW